MSTDLIDGTKRIFERLWKLVIKAKNNEIIHYNQEDLEQIKNINKNIFIVRNTQLSMVIFYS